MKKLLMIVLILAFTTTAHADTFRILKMGVGRNSSLTSVSLASDKKDCYFNTGFILELGKKFKHFNLSIEPSVYHHSIEDSFYDETFMTVGCKGWISKDFFTKIRFGIGGGFGTFLSGRERDSSNYVGTSGLIGEMGIKIAYVGRVVTFEYLWNHFSDPLDIQHGHHDSDRGMNYDEIRVGVLF